MRRDTILTDSVNSLSYELMNDEVCCVGLGLLDFTMQSTKCTTSSLDSRPAQRQRDSHDDDDKQVCERGGEWGIYIRPMRLL